MTSVIIAPGDFASDSFYEKHNFRELFFYQIEPKIFSLKVLKIAFLTIYFLSTNFLFKKYTFALGKKKSCRLNDLQFLCPFSLLGFCVLKKRIYTKVGKLL